MTAGGASQGGRYRPARQRRASTVVFALLSVAAAVSVVLVGLAARAVVASPPACPRPVVVRVAAAGEVAPAVQRLGRYFNARDQIVDGHCAQVAVRPAAPAAVAAELADGTGRARQPAPSAWIPDSALWVDAARATAAGARRVPASGPVLARTALVIAMPRPSAARTPAFGSSVGWGFLLPQSDGGPVSALGLAVQFPNPLQSAAGLATLIEVRNLLGHGRQARFALARFAFNVQVIPAPAGGTSPAGLREPPRQRGPVNPVTVTSEQAVVQYDRAHPQDPLAVRYPAQGTAELTYPYLVTATGRVQAAVAGAFGEALRSRYAAAYLRYEGFRAGGAGGDWPAGYGLDRRQPALLPPPSPTRVLGTLQGWQRLTLGERLIAATDVSAAMAVRVSPGGPTLEQVLGHAAALGLARFPNSTQMALWEFASHLAGSSPYRQLVPMGPLPAPFGLVSRRQAMEHLAGLGTTVPAGAQLYRTILAAYQQMVSTYQARYVNAVIVMTAGVESPRGDIPAGTLLRELKLLYNRSKPVNIIVIMVGRAGNFAMMQQVAAATNGKVYDITSPQQISQVFYQAMGRLICRPHCHP